MQAIDKDKIRECLEVLDILPQLAKEKRQQLGLSAERLGAILYLSSMTVLRFEKGKDSRVFVIKIYLKWLSE